MAITQNLSPLEKGKNKQSRLFILCSIETNNRHYLFRSNDRSKKSIEIIYFHPVPPSTLNNRDFLFPSTHNNRRDPIVKSRLSIPIGRPHREQRWLRSLIRCCSTVFDSVATLRPTEIVFGSFACCWCGVLGQLTPSYPGTPAPGAD